MNREINVDAARLFGFRWKHEGTVAGVDRRHCKRAKSFLVSSSAIVEIEGEDLIEVSIELFSSEDTINEAPLASVVGRAKTARGALSDATRRARALGRLASV